VPEEMRNDYWLESHFQEMVQDEILGTYIYWDFDFFFNFDFSPV
jgi:hypothetical protein